MILSKLSETSQIELLSKESLRIHYGRVSVTLSDDEFLEFTSMFDPSTGENMPDEKVCSVQRVQKGLFLVYFKGVTLQMCGHALAKFSDLLLQGRKEYQRFFTPFDESQRDIDNLLQSIEKKVQQD
jgi:hypothetical protein